MPEGDGHGNGDSLCGIVGFTHKKSIPDFDPIYRATRALIHRGPNQQGVHVSKDISIGVVRLKIIDLAGGDQPIFSADGDTVIAFNGEIYNHAEIRSDLRKRGYRFNTRSDTEVLLNAYLEWGKECFVKLRGMFAVALWTESKKCLVLARDRMGIKPLYFYRRGQEVYFGSELKALFQHPEVNRCIDLAGLNHYLSLNYVPAHRTLVEGIEKLSPGWLMEWTNGECHLEPYWELEFQPDSTWTLESAKQELDSLLRKSVREHLSADVPVGLWLSGGLDSSTILYYAASELSTPLRTFSVSFPGQTFDESRYFRQLASNYGTEHHEVELSPDTVLPSVVEELVTCLDEPNADGGAFPLWYLAEMSRRHVVVALSGDGGDELFGGYVTYKADLLARWFRHTPSRARRLLSKMVWRLPVSDEKISFEYKMKRFLEGCSLSEDEAHTYWNGTFSKREKNELLRNPVAGPPVAGLFDRLPATSPSLGFLNRYLWFDQCYYLPDDILTKVDRVSMAHSIEVRPPFLDSRIVDFAATLPENLKIRNSQLKYVLRELMKDRLPASILRRKKEGFDIPTHEWLRGCLRPLLLDTLTADAVESSGLFEWPVINFMIRQHLERRANLGYRLWGLLVLFLWIKRWNIQTQPVAEMELSLASRS